MKTKEEEVEDIVKIIKDKGFTAYEISKSTNLTEHGVAKIINGQSKRPHQSTIEELRNFLNGNKKVVDNSTEELKVNEPHSYDYYENKHDNKFVALPNGQYYMLMPLAEVSVQAGLLDNFKDVDYLADLPQHGIIVDKPAQGRYVAFRVSGDSMEDGTDGSIKYNSIVSTRELQRHLWASKLRFKDFPFWVIYTTQSKMPLLKQIVEHNTEDGYIVCHSLNDSPQYSDFKLEINDIQALFYVIDYNVGLSKKLTY